MTKLTVGLSVYNAMPHLPEMVESILTQSYRDFKFLIINDGSTDGSGLYLDSLRDPRISIIHKENEGLGATINYMLDYVDTEFYARMDADDISLPERLKTQLSYMQAHHETVMVSTQVAFLVGGKRFIGPRKPLRHDEIYSMLLKGNAAVCHGACMFRTEALKKVGGYRIKRAGQDTDIFLRMCEVGEVSNIDDVLYLIRIHRSSQNYIRREEVMRGRAFSILCASCRQQGIVEPTFDDFCAVWNNRSCFRKFKDHVDSWSAVAYRRSLLDIADSKKVRGYIRLCCAALCRPQGVKSRILSWIHGGR